MELLVPLFYFDFVDDEWFVQDQTGVELPDVETAELEASRALGDIAQGILPGSASRFIAVEVRDSTNRPLWRTSLRLAVRRFNGFASSN
jgi:hypothetical protein